MDTLDSATLAWLDDMGDEYTDDTTDMQYRAGYSVQRIARRNSRKADAAILTECGHCGEIVDAATSGAEHVAHCHGTRRRATRSKYADWRSA